MCVRDLPCVRACVCVCALLVTVVTAAPDSTSTWMRPQPQQTLHSLMLSIDERLHSLETSRWESTLKQAEQRLDSLETAIRRLDSAFQDRLDKLERSLNSKELKDELTVEKLSHKLRDILDSSYDRYNRRLGYTEERLELSFKKVQMSVEGSLNRIEKQQEDIQTEVLEAITTLEDLKTHSSTTEDKINSTHKAMQQHIQSLLSPNHEELQRISGSLEQLGSRLNSSLGMWGSQNDGPQVSDVIFTIRNEISNEGTKFTSKVNNMYNDLWRRMVSVETLVKDLSRLGNTTRREVLEEVRSLVVNEHRDFPGDSQENFMEVAMDALERKLQRKLLEVGRKLDTLSATQNLVMDSCFNGDTCRGLESRLSQVLEKIFDVFSDKIDGFSNRTFDLDGLVMDMMELVKNQHSQLIRTVTHNTNMVVTLAKDSSDATKLLRNEVMQLAEKAEYNFQELHDEVQEVSNSSGKVCTSADKNHERNNNQQKHPETQPKNITEIKVITVNVTQPTKNITKKHHDEGVLKITTDDINILADNSTLENSMQRKVESSITGLVDMSIMQVVGMISPNLTENQLETLLQYLNSSVSLTNLEAIIQNTEAKSVEETITEEGSVEIYDVEPLNKTNVEDDLTVLESKDSKSLLLLPENSEESENVSDEAPDESDSNDFTDTAIVQNGTEVNETVYGTSKTEVKSSKMTEELKEQLKVYVLFMKIKQGDLNITTLWEQIQKQYNRSRDQIPIKVPLILQKLCYGEESTKDLTEEYTNDIMRTRLLLINQTINDVSLYEKIENICNTIIESQQSENTEEITSDD